MDWRKLPRQRAKTKVHSSSVIRYFHDIIQQVFSHDNRRCQGCYRKGKFLTCYSLNNPFAESLLDEWVTLCLHCKEVVEKEKIRTRNDLKWLLAPFIKLPS